MLAVIKIENITLPISLKLFASSQPSHQRLGLPATFGFAGVTAPRTLRSSTKVTTRNVMHLSWESYHLVQYSLWCQNSKSTFEGCSSPRTGEGSCKIIRRRIALTS
jgi:hypothetical protein